MSRRKSRVAIDRPALMTVLEVALELGVHEDTVRKLARTGEFTAVKVLTATRYPRVEVEAYIERQLARSA